MHNKSSPASPVEHAQIQLLVSITPKENVVDIEIAMTPCDVVLTLSSQRTYT